MAVLYLLDANVLIDANLNYYQFERIPQFWRWIEAMARNGALKLPSVILDEITPSAATNRGFHNWIQANREQLLLAETAAETELRRILIDGYGYDPSPVTALVASQDTNDAQLVACASLDPGSRVIVTLERYQHADRTLPQPHKRRIPLVCQLLGIRCIDTFDLIRELDFRIPLANAHA